MKIKTVRELYNFDDFQGNKLSRKTDFETFREINLSKIDKKKHETAKVSSIKVSNSAHRLPTNSIFACQIDKARNRFNSEPMRF